MTEICYGDKPKGGAAEAHEDSATESITAVEGAFVEDEVDMVLVADEDGLYMAAKRATLRTSS
eukprot:COSAG02_NODE_21307_length_794_cov_0.623022_2_plen_62_part_01